MKKTVLIVEDEPTLSTILAERLEKEGMTILTANNGQIGLVTALKEHPDLIMLDILMPVMDGIKMLDELRQDSWGKSAQVILLTNLSDTEKQLVSSHLDVSDYLIKCNLSIDLVVKKVKKMLKLK